MLRSLTSPGGTIIAILLYAIAFVASQVILTANDHAYKCGNLIFSAQAVKNAITLALKKLPDRSSGLSHDHNGYPAPYKGLHNEYASGHFIYQVFPEGQSSNPVYPLKSLEYFVIFDLSGNAVNMISGISAYGYFECAREQVISKAASTPPSRPPTHNDVTTNGYDCDKKFVSDHIVALSLKALTIMPREENSKYPAPYHSPNLNTEQMYTWPIYDRNRLHVSGRSLSRKICIVVDQNLDLKDVIFYDSDRKPISCHRTLNPQITSFSSISEQILSKKAGYSCDNHFFSKNYVKHQTQMAHAAYIDTTIYDYLTTYGDSFFGKIFIWPIFPDGSQYPFTRLSSYLIMLDLKFKVICVGVKSPLGLTCCGEIAKKKIDETENFDCYGQKFLNERLLSLVKFACKNQKIRGFKYPAQYNGPDFDVEGPYKTWPLHVEPHRDFEFSEYSLPTGFRVVIGSKCKLAGVLWRTRRVRTGFIKCLRANSRVVPGGYTTEHISETSRNTRVRKISTTSKTSKGKAAV